VNAIDIVRRRSVEIGAWPAHAPALLRRVMAARGIADHEQTQLRLAQLHPPELLAGIGEAAELLIAAIDRDAVIVIAGDFDCDGATGTAVAVRGLRLLGARQVRYRVPNRSTHGYGLSPALVNDIAAMAPNLVMTVDSGIACHDGVAAAKAMGWQVIVTDHHLPGAQLPTADAIVNPNCDGDHFPSKSLAGVGVMFYLLLEVRRRLRARGSPAGDADLSSLLDLVAIGTVADMVKLDRNNRVLVAAGLTRIRRGLGNAGVQALIAVSGRESAHLSCADIGFALAPRLNAAGRLEDMSIGIACLLSDDPAQARSLATQLDAINAERRVVQQQMVDEAERLAARIVLDADALPAALCLFDPGWHPGVVGLVASRLKDRLHRPVLAFAPASTDGDRAGEPLRGSARSIPGFHIRDALALVDARHPGMIERFGGHAMAAGLSLAHDALPAFTNAFTQCAAEIIDPAMLARQIETDGPLLPDEFTLANAQALAMAGPWGQGFPEPLFEGVFDVLDWKLLGERHLRLELQPEAGGAAIAAIHFGGWAGQPPPATIRIVYQLAVNRFRGREALQLIVQHCE
jgi:single-stranded-DNA-specific exonuclease